MTLAFLRRNIFDNSSIHILSNLASIIPSAALSLLNKLTPIILTQITKFEEWDYGHTEINMLLFRSYLSDTLNLLILAFSYYLLADPVLFANYAWREYFDVQYLGSAFSCRLDQVADGLYILVITNFITKLFSG